MGRPSGHDDDGWSAPSYGGGTRAGNDAGRGGARSGAAGSGYPPPPGQAPAQRQGPPDGHRPAQDPRTSTRVFDAQRDGRNGPVAAEDWSPARSSADGWSPAGPTSARDQRATRLAERRAAQESLRTEKSIQRLQQQAVPAPYERGTRWWAALLVLIAVTSAGAVVDSVASLSNQDGFNVGIVVGSIVAILMVKRSQMFPIVIAPPIVYSLASLVQLYLKSSLSQDHRGAINTIIDAVQNYLVFGFPALATATAAVLIIAGIRLVTRK